MGQKCLSETLFGLVDGVPGQGLVALLHSGGIEALLDGMCGLQELPVLLYRAVPHCEVLCSILLLLCRIYIAIYLFIYMCVFYSSPGVAIFSD